MLMEFYVTRDPDSDLVEVWPTFIGIETGRVCYYAAVDHTHFVQMQLSLRDCRTMFGFCPREREAWLVSEQRDGNFVIERQD